MAKETSRNHIPQNTYPVYTFVLFYAITGNATFTTQIQIIGSATLFNQIKQR
jgi:hypothetical protein